jgi:hypothetical protein
VVAMRNRDMTTARAVGVVVAVMGGVLGAGHDE